MPNEDFPLRVDGVTAGWAAERRPEDVIPAARTDAWQLVYVRSGTIEERCDDRRVLLRAGGLLFHQPAETFGMRPVGEVPPDVLRLDFLCTQAGMDRFRGAVFHAEPQEQHDLNWLMDAVTEYFEPPDTLGQATVPKEEQLYGAQQQLAIHLENLLILLARRYKRARKPGVRLRRERRQTALVDAARTYFAKNLERELRGDGVTVEPHPWLEGCLEITGTGDLRSLPAFREGRFLVQDAAARLAAMAASAAPGDRVLDVCAAPGGKSFSMAMDMGDRGQILSCDVHPYKVKLIESGAQRLGLTCIRAAAADAREKHAAWEGQADVVMADVPCSGLGIIRKKPDIRYKNPKELAQLPLVRRAILENASGYVRPGGTLVYSTCTVLPEENEDVTGDFLDKHPEFEPVRTAFPLPVGPCPGQVTLWPQRHGTDGFYICRMRRKD